MRKSGADPPIKAAKRRKNAAHGASRGSQVGNEQAPEGRKNSYDKGSVGTLMPFRPSPAGQFRSRKGNYSDRPVGGYHSLRYVVIYERSRTGWAAYVPDLPGVVTTGGTKEEVRSLIQEAITFHLDGLQEDHLPIPVPSAEAEVISVPR
jgi:predicted RNase H-like HicB family nuclease